MRKIDSKIRKILEQIRQIDSGLNPPVISESVSESCPKQLADMIRDVVNTNKKVLFTYKDGIHRILKDLYPDNYYEEGKYHKGSLKGIFNLENEGRSYLNMLDTNYNAFCVLLRDMNIFLLHLGEPKIKLTNVSPQEQVKATERFIDLLFKYRHRIFSDTSSTFKAVKQTLKLTSFVGEKTENLTIQRLKQKFGQKNVLKVSELGSKEDFSLGIDCRVILNSIIYTAQIKPYSDILIEGEIINVYDSGKITNYNTDWIIFSNKKSTIIFKTNNSKIDNSVFVFPKEDLIYVL